MINNPVYVKKGGAAVDTLDLYTIFYMPIVDSLIMYEGKEIGTDDMPIAYHGGEVQFIENPTSIKIEGNVLYFGY